MRILWLVFLSVARVACGDSMSEYSESVMRNEEEFLLEDFVNDFSDDYEQFQDIIFKHFKAKRERGDKIHIPQIMKLLSGEFECPNDQLVKEIDADRVSAMNDRDSLYSRLEILDEQLIKTEGQVALREYELQQVRQEVSQLREMVRGFESHQLLHELSVQQHCTDLVMDLSRCRGELTSYFEDRTHLHQLHSDYEGAKERLQDCHKKLEVAEKLDPPQPQVVLVCPDSRGETISAIGCSRAILSSFTQRISSKIHTSTNFLWSLVSRAQEYLSPVVDELCSLYFHHLHPLYLSHLHPTAQVLHREFLFFLNTPLMVEASAYYDLFIRKCHVLLYRLQIEIPRYADSISRFGSIVVHRTIWNVDRFIGKLSRILSVFVFPGHPILSSEEWYFLLILGLLGGTLWFLAKLIMRRKNTPPVDIPLPVAALVEE